MNKIKNQTLEPFEYNKSNGWRTLAIIFFILLVLETLFIVWAFQVGSQDIENENQCSINVCADADSYSYVDGLCECYSNNKVYHSFYFS